MSWLTQLLGESEGSLPIQFPPESIPIEALATRGTPDGNGVVIVNGVPVWSSENIELIGSGNLPQPSGGTTIINNPVTIQTLPSDEVNTFIWFTH